MATKCDSSVGYKVRHKWVTKCDRLWITKCDKIDYKLRQGLQGVLRWITKCDRDYKVWRNYKVWRYNTDILMISETKLDESFPPVQFVFDGYSVPFRFDRNRNGGGILLYIREDLPSKLLSMNKNIFS